MSELLSIKAHFHKNLGKCLDDIKLDFDAGYSDLDEQEYEELCISYLAMLESGNETYYYDTRCLSMSEQESLMMGMSKGLYRQYIKDPTSQIVALAVQLKHDADNIDLYKKMFSVY